MFKRLNIVLGAIAFALGGFSQALAQAAHDPDYQIRPGDELNVIVYGESNLTQTVKVLPGGAIVVPLAGQIIVGGMTPTQAGRAVGKAFSSFLKRPNVTVAVSQEAPVEVLVLGNVKSPGRYQLQPQSRLTDALAAAGGLGPTDGDLPTARLETPGKPIRETSLQRLLREGDVSLNVPIGDETTVYVPSPLTLDVQVLGAVEHPGDVTLHEGDRLSRAIARAGTSPNVSADLNHVTVRRMKPNGQPQTTTVNMYEALHGGDVAKDPVLQKGDLVYVPQGSSGRGTASAITTIFYGIALGLRQLVGP
jgi:polysaccharide export outer membrane protein